MSFTQIYPYLPAMAIHFNFAAVIALRTILQEANKLENYGAIDKRQFKHIILSLYKRNIFSFFPLSLLDSEDAEDKSSVDNKKLRRKGKVHEIKEESQITNDFAQNLDLSCMSKGLVKAPAINNGYVAKYNR